MSKYNSEKEVESDFLDLKVPIFRNKTNGQMSIALPKKEIKRFIDLKGKKVLPIRIFKGGGK